MGRQQDQRRLEHDHHDDQQRGEQRQAVGSSNAWNNVKTTTSNAFNNVLTSVTNAFNNVVSFVAGIPGRVLSALGNLGSTLFNSGWSMIDGLRRGIVDGFNNAVTAVKNGLNRVRNFFPFSPAKEGPFSGCGYTDKSGRALVSDFASGMAGG